LAGFQVTINGRFWLTAEDGFAILCRETCWTDKNLLYISSEWSSGTGQAFARLASPQTRKFSGYFRMFPPIVVSKFRLSVYNTTEENRFEDHANTSSKAQDYRHENHHPQNKESPTRSWSRHTKLDLFSSKAVLASS
jgi:hypothetical protein